MLFLVQSNYHYYMIDISLCFRYFGRILGCIYFQNACSSAVDSSKRKNLITVFLILLENVWIQHISNGYKNTHLILEDQGRISRAQHLVRTRRRHSHSRRITGYVQYTFRAQNDTEICARESSQRDSKDCGGTPPPRISTNGKLRSAIRANRLRPAPTTCVSDMSLFTHPDRFSSANVALRLILWIVNRVTEAWRNGLANEFLTSGQLNSSLITV